jgi:hypothetical protein
MFRLAKSKWYKSMFLFKVRLSRFIVLTGNYDAAIASIEDSLRITRKLNSENKTSIGLVII